MAQKKTSKTRYLDVNVKQGTFVSKFLHSSKKQDFSDIKILRNLLSNEKARILYCLKTQKPKSIYELAKILGRDFKSVRDDVLVLKRFGFVEFQTTWHGKRKSYKPYLAIEQMNLVINV